MIQNLGQYMIGFTAILGDPKFGAIHVGLSHCIAHHYLHLTNSGDQL